MARNTLGFSLLCRAVPSQHSWISRAKLAQFGMLQLRTIPVYTGKSKHTVHAVLPCPTASVNAL